VLLEGGPPWSARDALVPLFVYTELMATSTLLTIDDFERLPADVSGNTPRHNLLRDRLLAFLLPLITQHHAGTIIAEQEYDFDGNAHGPDVSFFGPSKQASMDLDKRVQRFVPDLAIEIASASDTYEGLLIKKERYLKAGTSEVWLISPLTHEIAIYAQGRTLIVHGAGRITTELLPGISISLEELFQQL
jgi:Uma2 family endonuclease